jgi:hypothetical protein
MLRHKLANKERRYKQGLENGSAKNGQPQEGWPFFM